MDSTHHVAPAATGPALQRAFRPALAGVATKPPKFAMPPQVETKSPLSQLEPEAYAPPDERPPLTAYAVTMTIFNAQAQPPDRQGQGDEPAASTLHASSPRRWRR